MSAVSKDSILDLSGEGSPTETKLDRIVAHLSQRVTLGEWQEGKALPSRNRLAEEYGVSPSTISNAISQLQKAGLVHAVPSRGVFASAVDQEHSQKAVAPAVALRGSYVTAEEGQGSYYGRSLVHAIWDAAHEHNAPLILMPGASEHSRLTRQLCQAQGARGAIFLGRAAPEEAHELRAAGFPVVLANRPAAPTPLNYVDYDHAQALRDTIRRFVEAGHQRIAVIIPPTNILNFYDWLKPIFIELLCDYGLVTNFNRYWLDGHHVEGATDERLLEENLIALIRSEEPPTAVLCFSYSNIASVRRAEEETGAKLSIVAMGYHRAIDAKVSGFVLQQAEFGKALLKAIYRAIEEPMVFIQQLIPLIYVDKGTVLPPG